jgi:hypothetical protein
MQKWTDIKNEWRRSHEINKCLTAEWLNEIADTLPSVRRSQPSQLNDRFDYAAGLALAIAVSCAVFFLSGLRPWQNSDANHSVPKLFTYNNIYFFEELL